MNKISVSKVKIISPIAEKVTEPLEDAPIQFSSPFVTEQILDYFSASQRDTLCLNQDRYWIYNSERADEIVTKLKTAITNLTDTEILLIDFSGVSPDADFLLTLTSGLFFPESFGVRIIDRIVRGKKVVLTNMDSPTLLNISLFLALAQTSCLAIENTKVHPWNLLHVGHIDNRLESLLEKVFLTGEATVSDLIENRQSKNADEIEKETARIASFMKELYDYGFVDRVAHSVEGQRHKPFQYSIFHPYKYKLSSFTTRTLNFVRFSRSQRRLESRTVQKTGKDEEPEPVFLSSLQPEERTLLSVLSCFPSGSFRDTLQMALDSQSWRHQPIKTLIEKGLVSSTKNAGRVRYRVVSKVREELISYLQNSSRSEWDAVRLQSANSLRELGGQVQKGWDTQTTTWKDQLQLELPNIANLIDWCVEQPIEPTRVQLGLHFLNSIRGFLESFRIGVEEYDLLLMNDKDVAKNVKDTSRVIRASLNRRQAKSLRVHFEEIKRATPNDK